MFLLFLFTCPYVSLAQAQQSQKLKVFLDCSSGCDEQFIRTEITLVDFVLDRLAADVHLLIISRQNGSGGKSIKLSFLGQNGFSQQKNEINCSISANATAVEQRSQITQSIKLGLVPYLSNGPLSDMIRIELKDLDTTGKTATKDKWNYWVFRAGLDGSYNTDQIYRSSTGSGNISANRTTDKLRVNFSAYGNYNFAKYNYEQNGITQSYVVTNTDNLFSHYLVKSLSSHWSAGYELSYSNSTFSNNKRRLYASPAIEYAIFPYSMVNEKFFAISYALELRNNQYYDTTIYNQTSETLSGHRVKANLSVRQKWGSVTTAVTYSNYFHDWHLNNVALSLNVDVRVTGGLFFYMYASGGLVHDQIYLVKGDATEQEILTRRRQLASSYNFYSGVGISYRFGSILNNFVNPRFAYW